LADDLFKKLDIDLITLSGYFEISKMQAFLLANILVLNYQGDTVDLNDLVNHFGCNPLRLLELNDDFDVLYSKRLLLKHASRNRTKIIFRKNQFIVNEKIADAILHNLPMPEFEKRKFANFVDFLEELDNLAKRREDGEFSAGELLDRTGTLIGLNLHLPFIRKINDLSLKMIDVYFYYQIVWQTVTGSEKTYLGFPSGSFFDKTSDWINYVQEIIHNENTLAKLNLIEIEKADFFIDIKMKLSDYSLNMLKEEGITLYLNK
jgi:hypothetical protein